MSGEYLVLKGAKALAVPVKFGQYLNVNPAEGDSIRWIAKDYKVKVWFEVQFALYSLDILNSTDSRKAEWLRKILVEAGAGQKISHAINVETKLDFPNDWGLGSSSTLISLVAEWMDENPLDLHFKVSKGSGYDVAVAKAKSAILFSRQGNGVKQEKVDWNPPFRDNVFFVHLNKKQNSDDQIVEFENVSKNIDESVCNQFSEISEAIFKCEELNRFNQLIALHEAQLSEILNRKTVKELYFSDYTAGEIKSLGAWGGDFILVTGDDNDMKYFLKKDFTTILSWNEMVFHG
jgi:mevalonate kinase